MAKDKEGHGSEKRSTQGPYGNGTDYHGAVNRHTDLMRQGFMKTPQKVRNIKERPVDPKDRRQSETLADYRNRRKIEG